jgi:hypothetical protein
MIGIVITYGISALLTSIFMCTPIRFFWDRSIKGGRCMNMQVLWLSNAIFDIATDIAILLLPMPTIWSLNMPVRQRMWLILVFVIGGL